jgi:chromate transporter
VIQLFLAFIWLSLISWGGGAAVLPEMQRVCQTNAWADATEFAHCYNLGQMTPGPPCLMVALLGWRVYGLGGAVTVLAGFVIPSSIISWAVGRAYRKGQGSPRQDQLRRTLAPITVGLIAASLDLLGRQNLPSPTAAGLCIGCAALILARNWHPGVLVVAAAALGPWLFG